MWFLIARAPKPDAPQWRGRRILAALDALLWPVCWSAVALQLSPRGDIVRGAVVVVSVFAAARRLHRALWNNHRYRFTTWRLARWIAVLLGLGAVLKLWLLLSV